MTKTEAEKLRVGEQVQWDSKDLGEVIEATYAAVRVRWNDGTQTLFTFHDVAPISVLSRAEA